MSILGVIQAGGRNTRYGAHKALAAVAGAPILERVRAAVAAVAPDVVLVANEPEVYRATGLEIRPDAREGAGALGGILTALYWARERGAHAALVVACDMPFVSADLLRALVAERAGSSAGPDAGPLPDVVAPESGGRRGVEPLCALYGTRCIEPIERALDRGDRRVISFFDDVLVHPLPLERVRTFGDPAVLFMNVNKPEERERAETIAAGLATAATARTASGALSPASDGTDTLGGTP